MKPGSMKRTPRGVDRRSGNAVLLSILLISLMAALAAAQFTVVHKNLQSSSFFLTHSDLHKYAECGINLAMHDLTYNVSGNGGGIGINGWTPGNDHGRDGQSGTFDEGEGDGIPTPGEPNVAPVSIGADVLQAGLMVYVTDTSYPDVKRVVSTATNGQAMSTVDTFVLRKTTSVSRLAAVYVDPDVVLDLSGSSFMIDGNDHDLDGTKNAKAPVPGIGTEDGASPGENRAKLLAQIPAEVHDQILGKGGSPSVDEVGGVDVDDVFEAFRGAMTQTYAGGTYSSVTLGTLADMEVTYVSGDLYLTGNGGGAGVLLVDGSLEITDQFTFKGLVVVRGDVRLSGGDSPKQIYGSLMVGSSVREEDGDGDDDDDDDDDDGGEDGDERGRLRLRGTTDLYYCSEILDRLSSFLASSYVVVYYDER